MADPDQAVTIVAPPASPVDLAIQAWLHAKQQHSQSAETHRSYETTLLRFRSLLIAHGLDLDAGDPRRVQHRVDAEDQWHDHERPARVAQLVDDGMVAIALLAQSFAARSTASPAGDIAPAPNTINLRLAILSSFYAYALRQGLLHGANPIARVERVPAHAYTHAQALDQETLVAALDAIPRETPAGARDYALLIIGLFTGRRLSELAAMSHEHVTIRRAAVEIRWPHCKGGRSMRDTIARHGPQSLPAQALLTWLGWLQQQDTQGANDALVPATAERAERPIWISLAHNGTFGHRLSLQGMADICAARLGTSKVHTLRHTFARALEDAGAKVSEIQARLGHSSLDTTSRYLAHLRADVNPHLGKLTNIYGLQSHLAPEEPIIEE